MKIPSAEANIIGEGSAPAALSNRAPLLIHLGFHKTGSTWLYEEIFQSSERGFSVPVGEPRHRLVQRLVVPDPLFYDPVATANNYAPHLNAAKEKSLSLVLSHERLSGYPSSGGRDRQMIAERLRQTFPEARVLIVLREQRALIRSMYSQHITDGGVESIGRYLKTPEPGLGRKPSFSLCLYEFDRLIEHYRQLFGPDRVLVLPFEMLGRRPQDFVEFHRCVLRDAARSLGRSEESQ